MKVNEGKKMYTKIKKLAFEWGADLFGVADIEAIKEEFLLSQTGLKNIKRAVCLGVRLSSAVMEDVDGMPTRLYFYHYKTANAFLDQLAFRLSGFIQNKGYLAMPIPASQIVDWKTQKAHLSHKRIAYMAGLGWLGRNNLLVNKKLGSQFRLATILTDMPLKADKPVKDGCASCKMCVNLCPAAAIKNSYKDFDPLKCFEKIRDFQKHRQIDQYVCGVCIKACKAKPISP